MSASFPHPRLIAHADWSTTVSKRWMTIARLVTGRYEAMPAVRVAESATLLADLRREAAGKTALLGFDFPIGVPRAYARAAGIRNFAKALPGFGKGSWREFFDVARQPAEISLRRPFYPFAPGGTRRQQLLDALNFSSPDELYRQCEKRTAQRAAASCLFWTLGAKQAGRAAIAGWREILQPGMRNLGVDLGLWPFDGALSALLSSRPLVVCETYPANAYGLIGAGRAKARWSKRRSSDRRAWTPVVRSWARERSIKIHPGLDEQLREGFGDGADGEDAFDSMMGLLSMISVVQNPPQDSIPLASKDLAVEGWMLGLRVEGTA